MFWCLFWTKLDTTWYYYECTINLQNFIIFGIVKVFLKYGAKVIILDYSEEIEETINNLKNEGYITEADDVTLVVGSRLEGYGMGEYQVNYFDCAYVKCSDFNKN